MSAPLILGTNSIKDVGYNVDNSLRFNDGSSDHLTKTLTTATNRKKFTISLWVKRGNLGGNHMMLAAGTNGSNRNFLYFQTDDTLIFYDDTSNVRKFNIETTEVFRDVSAWYHIVVAYDSTQSTSSDRIKIYKNGSQITTFDSSSYPDQNFEPQINSSVQHVIGSREFEASDLYYDGYISEYVFIDGQALDPTSFGEFDDDTGIWKPIDVSGLTFGTNGFYLDFENSGSLGADVSGNGNNFTVNNLTSIDQTTDTCTNNFATGNILDANSATLSEGNLKTTTSGTSWVSGISTMAVNQGKWYMEAKLLALSSTYAKFGVMEQTIWETRATSYPVWGNMSDTCIWSLDYRSGQSAIILDGSGVHTTSDVSVNDIFGIAVDLDNSYIYFHQNGTYTNSGDPTSGSSGTGGFALTSGATYFLGTQVYSNSTLSSNFGNPPFSISSGNSDGNGYGNFEYSVPSGYYALNTKNLAEYG